MSTQNVPVFVKYSGNNSTTDFPVTFPYAKKDYVKVYLKRKDEEQKLLGSDKYTWIDDVTIMFPLDMEEDLLQQDDVLAIQRETTLGSEFEFDNQRRLFPVEVMNADDLAFQQIQELARDLARCIKTPETSTKSPEELWKEYLEAIEIAKDAQRRAEESLGIAATLASTVEVVAAKVNQSATEAAQAATSAKAEADKAQEILDDIDVLLASKQDKLTAGENITIVNNVISATGGSTVESATESTEGIVYLATETEAVSGLNDSKAMTPLKTTKVIYDNVGRIIELGFNGTLESGVLTFEPADGSTYTLKHNYEYEVDLLSTIVGTLNDNVQVVIKNGTDTIRILNVLDDDTSTNITVGKLKQIQKYNTSTGYRWVFRGTYKVTEEGNKVFVMSSTVVNMSDEISKHNTSDTAHQDIRDLIDTLVYTKVPNVVVIGNLTEDDGDFSGFSENDYMKFPFIVDLSDKEFDIYFAFTTSNNIIDTQSIMDSKFGLAVHLYAGRLKLSISDDGESWTIAGEQGVTDIRGRQKYYCRLSYHDEVYKLLISEDGVEFTEDIVIDYATISPYPKTMYIGGGNIEDLGAVFPFEGSIDLKEARVVVNNVPIWNGMDMVGLVTKANVSLSNLDSDGIAVINSLIDNKLSPIEQELSEV